MCPQCRAFVTSSDKVCPYCDSKLGPRAIEMRTPGDALGGLGMGLGAGLLSHLLEFCLVLEERDQGV